MAQVRPSTGTPDQKESLQLQQHTKGQNWPTTINGFEDKTEKFMINSRKLSMQILSFFALALGFEEDFFDRAHNVTKEDAQSTLRLLYYPDITGIQLPKGYWRAGPHTDFDVLTLLFQHDGGEGLEICPGRKVQTSFAIGDEWTPVPAKTGHIVCNIGDMLMSWSDDRFKSNFHRVRAPDLGQNQQTRMSIAYFNQVNKNVIIQGPLKKYPALTGGDYILQAIARNFSSFK
ncbi:unnamed protein product [Didymodactylos carnosus]|nr:unnamed protein product [Didymodactylos carnosus]CAF3888824.1 unnamed protein product [Didymodactylos carnosus]